MTSLWRNAPPAGKPGMVGGLIRAAHFLHATSP